MPGILRNASMSSRVTAERTPAIGRTKYSIIPFVSGWLTSKRYSSPSATTSMPAISCVLNTTRVASISACWLGSAASQSGTGYDPTTVVRMAGFLVMSLPSRIMDGHMLRKTILNVHIYGGLLCFSYLIIFGISSLNFNHPFAFTRAKQAQMTWEQPVHVPALPTSSPAMTAEQRVATKAAANHAVREALGLFGH